MVTRECPRARRLTIQSSSLGTPFLRSSFLFLLGLIVLCVNEVVRQQSSFSRINSSPLFVSGYLSAFPGFPDNINLSKSFGFSSQSPHNSILRKKLARERKFHDNAWSDRPFLIALMSKRNEEGNLNGGENENENENISEKQKQKQKQNNDGFDGFENFPGTSASYFNTKSSILPNMYSEVLSRISPQEIIMKFYSAAPVRVQLALKSSLVSLMGGLPPALFKVRVEEDVRQMCSLLFKLQLLGYLFKNADISLARSSSLPSKRVGMSSVPGEKLVETNLDSDSTATNTNSLEVADANLRIKFEDGSEVDVSNPDHFLSNLLQEVESLRQKVFDEKLKQEIDRQANLINYLRSLDEKSVREMTTSIQPNTLVGMKKLVDHTISALGLTGLVESRLMNDEEEEEEELESDNNNNNNTNNIKNKKEEKDEDNFDRIKSHNVLGQEVQDGAFRIQDIPPPDYEVLSKGEKKEEAVHKDTAFPKKEKEKQVVILSQSREAMIQIFTWQIVNGYFLRELEQQQQQVEKRQKEFNARKDAMMKDMKIIAQQQGNLQQSQQYPNQEDGALGAINEMLNNGAKSEEAQQLLVLKQKLQERLREQFLAMEKAIDEETKSRSTKEEDGEGTGTKEEEEEGDEDGDEDGDREDGEDEM